ncbi:type I phosphomannose isomerase catalytic subunit [Fusobacterium mortiferum]|uniref:type I phosphomannose isomerase catalytic subunit n=1 Tax=Fusobacterium mortiferum TaxID=850 RepID=UPI001F1E3239|nr:type I phosphomannose isomerase catalytic subunit [Fusobacterium mortiferum]MCF2698466.1 class I mannose-6-phosphate isomerase [Fusobacterium mortiferum]
MEELTGERTWRTYIGGKLLDILQEKIKPEDNHFPEEWMFSTTRARNSGREEIVEGLSYIKNSNKTFLEYIKNSPYILGEKHVKRWGENLGVLVKLIDSNERLTIQVHPNNKKAQELFNSQFGKTEAWHILGTREEETFIYLGFKKGITKNYFIKCVEEQNLEKMLECLNKIKVKVDETYLVEGGVPHAIGRGCLILEIQEPTDYTIRVEKITPSGFKIDDVMCHQGLGFKKMFECFTFECFTEEEVRKKYQIKGLKKQSIEEKIITYDKTPCFSLTKLRINGKYNLIEDESYTCLYIIGGRGKIINKEKEIEILKNSQIFISANENIKIVTTEKLEILLIKGPKS